MTRFEVPRPGLGIVFRGFLLERGRALAAGDERDDGPGAVEKVDSHSDASPSAAMRPDEPGADVDEAAAVAQSRRDRIDGVGDRGRAAATASGTVESPAFISSTKLDGRALLEFRRRVAPGLGRQTVEVAS